VVAVVAGVGLAWPVQQIFSSFDLATYQASGTEIFQLGDDALTFKLSDNPNCELSDETINLATVWGLISGALFGVVHHQAVRRRHPQDNHPKDTMTITDPHALHAAWAERFNAKDLEGMLELYDTDAVLVTEPGVSTTGEANRQGLENLLGIGLPISVTVRRLYSTGDLALVLSDWSIKGTGADGSPVDLSGTTTDVLRRGAEGWKLAIDNPFGTV
jgi:ketosteroid isomerase-like protein